MVIGTSNSSYNKLHNNLLKSDNNLSSSIEKLSSGKKINKASDNPGVIGVLTALQAQGRGISQQIFTGQSELSMLQVAEGGLSSNSDILQRMGDLSLQAANGTLTDGDRASIQQEIDQLSTQLDRNAGNTKFNEKKLLDGSLNMSLSTGQSFSIADASAKGLGVDKLSVGTQDGAMAASEAIKGALDKNSSMRSSIGATQNAITSQISNLESSYTNTLSAQSAIEDVDMASQIIDLNRDLLQSTMATKAFNMQSTTATRVLELLS
jgi:flagellin